MSDSPTEADVRDRLDRIVDPCSEANGSNLSIVEMGLVDEIDIDGSHVTVDLRVTSPHCMMLPAFIDGADEEVGSLPSVESVRVNFDDGMEWSDDMITEEGQRKREQAHSDQSRRVAPGSPSPFGASSQ